MVKRKLDVVVISDVHLGTFACHALELLQYLNSLEVSTLIINGDFIDGWEFKKKFFPREHMEVLQRILQMAANGTKVYYLTGNHDDVMRQFSPMMAGNIIVKDKLELHIDHHRYWIFHGDIFDSSVTISPWIAKLGGRGYTWLVRLNRLVDNVRLRLGMARVSLANLVKHSVKRAVKYISDFEAIAIEHAARQSYQYVICGHIHMPVIRKIEDHGLTYMNSGDWVENLSALEYRFGEWSIYRYDVSDYELPMPRLNGKALRSAKTSNTEEVTVAI